MSKLNQTQTAELERVCERLTDANKRREFLVEILDAITAADGSVFDIDTKSFSLGAKVAFIILLSRIRSYVVTRIIEERPESSVDEVAELASRMCVKLDYERIVTANGDYMLRTYTGNVKS